MAQTTQGGIQFRNIYKDGGTNHGDTIKQDTWNANAAYPSEDNFPLANAVDIDWNEAQLPNSGDTAGNKEIKTSGDLLNLINEMNKRLYALTAAVIALSNK